MSGSDIIHTSNLRKVYRIGTEKVIALQRIDLTIKAGEICCVLGTSGSGKSTLLNMLAGLEPPSRGSILLFGEDISKMNERQLTLFRQKHIGFVFQSYNLLGTMTALENVELPLTFRGISKKRRMRAAAKILEAVGLGDRVRHKPTEMSGGQQQRVGIARAFVTKPRLVFADEPTGNLDTLTTSEVMNLMVNQCRRTGATMVLVTHDPNIAKYADRILTISDGSIISDVPNQSISVPLPPEDPARPKKSAGPVPKKQPRAPKKRPEHPAPPETPTPAPPPGKRRTVSLFGKKHTPAPPQAPQPEPQTPAAQSASPIESGGLS